jgi:uncharacterized protein
MTTAEKATVTLFDEDGVRGYLHRPMATGGPGLVLTHGAGGDCRMPLLVAVSEAFAGAGMTVLRCDLPFRQKRPKGPPSPSGAAADRAGLRAAVAALRRQVGGPLFLGGQSYGGRQATMVAADEPASADKLLLFSYPLHPPGRPERLRTEHFPRLRTPALFISGSSDPFGTADEIAAAIALIPAPTRLITIAGAGHDLKRGRFDLAAIGAALLELG